MFDHFSKIGACLPCQFSTRMLSCQLTRDGVTLHGSNIEPRCLIGMGAIILNGGKIGHGSIIAAGTLLLERTQIPAGSLVVGHPGKLKRPLPPIDQAAIDAYAHRYVEY